MNKATRFNQDGKKQELIKNDKGRFIWVDCKEEDKKKTKKINNQHGTL